MVALIPAAISRGMGGAQAQSRPAATPPPAATPAPAPTATPAPAASPSAAPPAAAETPAPVQTADPFGEEIILTQKPVVIIKGNANWDPAFYTLIAAFRTLSSFFYKKTTTPSANSLSAY